MGDTRWAAVALVARHQLRHGWRSMVVLGLLAGLVGAVVLGSAQLTRRTATAPERLATASQVDDARVVLFGGVEPAAVTSLPHVVDARVSFQGVGQLTSSEELSYTSVSGGPPSETVFTPVVIEGRPADPGSADEAVVAEEYAQESGVAVGNVVDLHLLTPEELASFDVGFGEPDGPRVQLEVTGIVRLSRDWAGGNGVGPLIATRAFADAHRAYLPVATVLVRLDENTQDVRRQFAEAVADLGADVPAPAGAEEYEPVSVLFPDPDGGTAVRSARAVLVSGLVVLVAVTALAGTLGVGQGLLRHSAGGAAAQRVEAALGLTTGARALARLLPASVGAAVAASVALAGALAAAGLEPLGALVDFEPEPGWRPDWWLVVPGAGLVAIVNQGRAALTAARTLSRGQGRRGDALGRPPGLVLRTRRAPAVAGTAFALTRGRTAVPVRATLVGAVLGVAGVVAAATFAASLDRLATTPARYGWAADFAWVDAKEPQLTELAARSDVAGLARVDEGAVRIGDAGVAAYAAEVRKGDVPWTVLAGRVPTADDEVALGERLADRLGVDVGDTVSLRTPQGEAAADVVGRVVVPSFSGERFGEVAVLTPSGLAAASSTQPFAAALVRADDPSRAADLYAELAADLELIGQSPPADVRNLLDLGRLPVALGLFLAVLSGTLLAHSLVLTTRRRAADLAVLRVLGFTPRQVAAALVSMAGITALVGVVLGLPLGLALGRVVWGEVAGEIGVAGDVALPTAVLVVLPVAVLLVAVVVSLLPARRAALVSPARVLRAE